LAPSLFARDKGYPLEPQYTPRTAGNTFTTGQAMAVLDRLAFPGMPADININRAIIRTNATLHTALRFRDNLPAHKRFPASRFIFYQAS